METPEFESKKHCYILFYNYIKELVDRMKQYKHELLASTLKLVLSVPKQFVNVKMMLPAIQRSLVIGLRYVPMANIGLDAIEKWLVLNTRDVLENLKDILPYLNDYLLVNTTDEYQEDLGKDTVNEEHNTDLRATLQRRILKLLGNIGGHNIDLIDVCYILNLILGCDVR